MTMTRYTLDDLGGALSPRALLHFVRQLPAGSRTWEATHPGRRQESAWARQDGVQMLLADIADSLHAISWEVAQAHSKRDLRAERPRPIPRPGVKESRKVYGHGAIPVSEFDKWWNGGRDGKH